MVTHMSVSLHLADTDRAVQLVVRSHEQWWHGIDQATPLRLQIDADGIEVYSR